MASILAFFKSLMEIISLLKAAWKLWQDGQEQARRKDFNDGVSERDTKKVEDAFDSDKAGRPVEGVGTIGDLPDVKNK